MWAHCQDGHRNRVSAGITCVYKVADLSVPGEAEPAAQPKDLASPHKHVTCDGRQAGARQLREHRETRCGDLCASAPVEPPLRTAGMAGRTERRQPPAVLFSPRFSPSGSRRERRTRGYMDSKACSGAQPCSQLAIPGENCDLCTQNASQDSKPCFSRKSGHGRIRRGAGNPRKTGGNPGFQRPTIRCGVSKRRVGTSPQIPTARNGPESRLVHTEHVPI